MAGNNEHSGQASKHKPAEKYEKKRDSVEKSEYPKKEKIKKGTPMRTRKGEDGINAMKRFI